MMRLTPVLGACALALVPAAANDAEATMCEPRKQISGTWKSNDGGTYRVRRVGKVVWWVGESGDDGQTWTNVFRGVLNGSTITGDWTDVRGEINNGTLTLELDGTLTALRGFRKTGGSREFGGSRWFFTCE